MNYVSALVSEPASHDATRSDLDNRSSDPFVQERRHKVEQLEQRKAAAVAAERYEEAGELKAQIGQANQEIMEHLASGKYFAEKCTADAVKLKTDGNTLFKKKDWPGAIEKYSAAIAIDATVPAYFTNRSVCQLKLKRWGEAKEDGLAAAALAPADGYVKGFLRAAQACAGLDDYEGMRGYLDDAAAEIIRDPSIKLAVDTPELCCEAAECALRCGKYAAATAEAEKALGKAAQLPLAHVIKADVLVAQEEYRAAMKVYEAAMMAGLRSGASSHLRSLQRQSGSDVFAVTGNNDQQLQQRVMRGMGSCQRELSKGKTPRMPRRDKDLYGVLGVTSDASDAEIKQAYRKQALAHHPDKHQGEGEDAIIAAEKQFKAIGEAYAVLSDTEQKRRYDAEGIGAISWNDLFPAGGGIDANEVWAHFKKQAGDAGAAFAGKGPEGVRVMMPTSPADITFGVAAKSTTAQSSRAAGAVVNGDRGPQ